MANNNLNVRRGIYLYINGQEVRNDIKSIEGEMRKLVNQQRNMTVGSDEYIRHGKKIRELKTIIADHNSQWLKVGNSIDQVQEKVSKFSKFTDVFNKYAAMGAAFVASITGVAMGFRKLSEENAKLDDIYSDVRKTTGLTREQVISLNEEFKRMDTRTAREELNELAADAGKLGISGSKDILDFVYAGNQIRVALGEDLGKDAIKNIGKISDVFRSSTAELDNLDLKGRMLSIGSAINELGQSSTASESYLVDFAKRLGGVASQSGISIQNILGYASALDQSGQAVEMSATAMQNFIMKLMADPAKFARLVGQNVKEFTTLLNTDTNAAIVKVLTSLNDKGGFQALIPVFEEMGLDGARAVGVLSSLATNIDMVTKAQKISNDAFSDATSITNEYAIKNNNLNAQLDKAKKTFKEKALEVGQMLNPALLKSVSAMTYLVKGILEIIPLYTKYKALILALAAATATYIIVQKISVAWKSKELVLNKLLTVSQNTFRAALYALQIAYYTFTGQASKARGAMVAFNLVCKANPWAALASAIVLVVTALSVWISNARKAASEAAKLYDINKKVAESTADQKAQLAILLSTARNELISKEKRLEAIKKLNEISPEYLGNLSLENINTEAARKSIDEYTKSIISNAKAQALREKITELYGEIADKENDLQNEKENPTRLLPFDSTSEVLQNIMKLEIDSFKKDIDFYLKKINETTMPSIEVPIGVQLDINNDKLKTLHDEKNALIDKMNHSQKNVLNLNPLQGTPLEFLSADNFKLKSLNEEIKNTQESIDRLTASKTKLNMKDKEPQNTIPQKEVDTSAVDLKYQQTVNLLKKSLQDKKLTENEYQDEMYQKEVEYLREKQSLYSTHSKEWEDLQSQIYDKELENAGVHNKRLIRQYDFELLTAQNKLKQSLLNRELSENEYNSASLIAEIATLQKKQGLQIQNSQEWETLQSQILDKQNSFASLRDKDIDQQHKNNLVALKTSLSENKITEEQYRNDVFNEEIAYLREKQKQHKKGAEEWIALEEKIADKTISEIERRKKTERSSLEIGKESLPIEDQMALNEILREKDLISEEEYLEEKNRLNELFSEREIDQRTQRNEMILSGVADLANMALSLMQNAQNKEERRINKKYDSRLKAAQGDSEATKVIEEQKEAELLQIKKKYADKQFAMQVLSITAETALAAMRAYSSALALGLPVGPILAPIMAGIAIASGMVQIASANSQRQQAQQLWSGGYTGSGNKYEPKQLIQTHGGEFVATKDAVENPFLRPLFDVIDQAQRSGRVTGLTSQDMALAIGGKTMASGGYTGFDNNSVINIAPTTDPAFARLIESNTRIVNQLTDRLNQPIESFTRITGPRGSERQNNKYKQLLKNASRS